MYTFDEYQKFVDSKCKFPSKYALVYTALGLVNETAELVEKLFEKFCPDRYIDTDENVLDAQDAHELVANIKAVVTAGKALGMYKKSLRGDPGKYIPAVNGAVDSALEDGVFDLSDVEKQDSHYELGDVQFYVAALAKALDSSAEQVARLNEDKLTGRELRGTIQGDGDNR